MQKIAALILFLLITPLQANDYDQLTYGEDKLYFELGEVDFYRSAGKLGDRVSDYNVTVVNNYGFDICLVPTFEIIKNGRIDYNEPSFIIDAGETVELGHYGAKNFGKSWHIKWDFFISQNLEYCAI